MTGNHAEHTTSVIFRTSTSLDAQRTAYAVRTCTRLDADSTSMPRLAKPGSQCKSTTVTSTGTAG